jgi:hypothetical protein
MEVTSASLEQGPPIRLTCYTKPTPMIIRIILGIIGTLAFVAPVVVLITMLASGDGFKIGIIVSFIIMWAIGAYLIRIVLWNTYGKEILEFSEDKLTYHCDYKYFQSNQKQIERNQIQIELISVN